MKRADVPAYGPAIVHDGRAFYPNGPSEPTPAYPFPCDRCATRVPAPKTCDGGYTRTPAGQKLCATCGAADLRAELIAAGHGVLYLARSTDPHPGWRVQNFDGRLAFRVQRVRETGVWAFGRTIPHRSAYFTGPDDRPWYGVQRGERDQLLRCRRLTAR